MAFPKQEEPCAMAEGRRGRFLLPKVAYLSPKSAANLVIPPVHLPELGGGLELFMHRIDPMIISK